MAAPNSEYERHSRRASHRFRIFRKFFDFASNDTQSVTFLQFNNALQKLSKKKNNDNTTAVPLLDIDSDNLDRVHDIALSTFRALDADSDGILTREEVDAYARRTADISEVKGEKGRTSPLSKFLMFHLKSSSDLMLDHVPTAVEHNNTSASVLQLGELAGDLIEDDDSSDGELGVEIDGNFKDQDVPPPVSGRLKTAEWSEAHVRASMTALDQPDTRDALLVIERSLQHFLNQQEYFRAVAEQNERLRKELTTLAGDIGRGPVVIPAVMERAPPIEEISALHRQMDKLAEALHVQMEENKVLRKMNTMKSHRRQESTMGLIVANKHQQQQQRRQRQSPTAATTSSPPPRSGFGRINDSHRTKRRDMHTIMNHQGKRPQRLHSVKRTDHHQDPTLLMQHEQRDFVRERSPDKSPASIRHASVARVDHVMNHDMLKLIKAKDINYVEHRSHFEAEVGRHR